MMIYTLGSIGVTIDEILELLKEVDAAELVDVRDPRFSIKVKPHSFPRLKKAMDQNSILYRYIGKTVSSYPNNIFCFSGEKLNINLLRITLEYKKEIAEIEKKAKTKNICILGSFLDPMEDFRGLVVSQDLHSAGQRVTHIYTKGYSEPHEVSIKRLVLKYDNQPFETAFQKALNAINCR
jgi:uncharacterized protein (DUF488 family)